MILDRVQRVSRYGAIGDGSSLETDYRQMASDERIGSPGSSIPSSRSRQGIAAGRGVHRRPERGRMPSKHSRALRDVDKSSNLYLDW